MNISQGLMVEYMNRLLTSDSQVLDIGCGTKELSNALACAKVTTIDSWEPFKPDILCDLNSVQELPFADGTFDLVLLIDVIEHLPKEHGFRILKEAQRVAKKAVVLLTPLWWDPNVTECNNPESPYYLNEYDKHQSLWGVEDLAGFTRLTTIDPLVDYFFGVWQKPAKELDLFFDLSHNCNYQCLFCRNSLLPREVLLLENIKDIDTLLALAKSVDITGYGEVTLHPQFDKFLQYFSKFNLPVRFVTNGSNLTKKTIELIMDSTVSEVVISLNSLNPVTYRKITGGMGNLYKVLAGIDNLIQRTSETKRKIRIIFSFVVSQYTFPEIKSIIDYAKRKDKEASLLDLTPTIKDYTPDLLVADTAETREYLKSMIDYRNETGAQVHIFNLDNRKAVENAPKDEKALSDIVKRCTWIYNQAFIGFNGDIGVCCWSKAIMGNILEQPFSEIWTGQKYQELRDCIRCGDLKYCRNCRREG